MATIIDGEVLSTGMPTSDGEYHAGPKSYVEDEALSADVRNKLDALREHVDALHADYTRLSDKMFEAGKEHSDAKLQFQIITDPSVAMRYGQAFIYEEDSPVYKSRKGAFDEKAKKHRDSIAKTEAAGERYHGPKALLNKVEKYIQKHGARRARPWAPVETEEKEAVAAGALKPAAKPAIKFPAVDRLPAEIEKFRNEGATLRADRHEILSAAFPSSEIFPRMKAEVEELARLGRPNVLQLIDHGPTAGIIWPNYETITRGAGIGVRLPGDIGFTRAVDAPHLPLIAWMFKDQLLKALEAELTEFSEDAHALSTEERVAKLKDIDARILANQRIEAALVDASGGAIEHRADIDPRAFLGVEGPDPHED
ncbi:hypothetical protein [Rhizobium sp. L43]|uniref:hypothetical protein n=1 Tax=Rhizobium sp. L43 TaxID=2035452 RepID=UPI000BE9CE8D|nr:hypothetical protein [Rhizobium sp. L43]PDS79158.1 hypothetical protein CO667_10095 [Rhizobium sp. L43]